MVAVDDVECRLQGVECQSVFAMVDVVVGDGYKRGVGAEGTAVVGKQLVGTACEGERQAVGVVVVGFHIFSQHQNVFLLQEFRAVQDVVCAALKGGGDEEGESFVYTYREAAHQVSPWL